MGLLKRVFPWKKPVTRGVMLDFSAKGTVVISGAVFLSAVLLRSAKIEAGCEVDPGVYINGTFVESDSQDAEVPECRERVYGIFPSSLLFVMGAVVSVFSAISMPVVGSFLDQSPYRRQAGAASAWVMVAANALQLMIYDTTLWFPVALLQLVSGVAYLVHNDVSYAYLPETTTDLKELESIMLASNMWFFCTEIVFLILVVIVVLAAGLETRGSAVVSQGLVTCWAGLFFGTAWHFLFEDRGARSAGGSTCSGFEQLYFTARRFYHEEPSVVRWLVGYAFADAAGTGITTVAATYLIDELGFEASELAIFVIVALLASIPGYRLGAYVTNVAGTHRSQLLAYAYWAAVCLVFPFVCYRPAHQPFAYVMGALVGVGYGWAFPISTAVYCAVTHGGHEAEEMGIFIFSGQIVGWLPPVIFLAMNESGIHTRWSIMALAGFFAFADIMMATLEFDRLQKLGSEETLRHRQLAETDVPGVSSVIPSFSLSPRALSPSAANWFRPKHGSGSGDYESSPTATGDVNATAVMPPPEASTTAVPPVKDTELAVL
eukprot:CAMPEP_0118982672 /NCGR_PEP_ID=MMETSP1173-20130426/33386_1 /TAXON_ID=1034831 /ORGANISM="Rhizochromulina marina cf, Strain CCMP1243" /LENGTH=546 /DNA_ID=CAMNT_0006933183 /DNA_START=117 /DNA_END=1754 /DNA_ORIENTATION=+